ncbi:hypothetical protein Poly59_61280 [Rubripirellula reticaptiva]|uniref:Uncharacterized protein n=1 Tax=Rubripirellula reticaptiva TaxID=2528013 RepID=A0A5C6E7M1_9BACT|nr:hypothetical protein Poly59_61280 [Rubripirellula reticaptiva]
MAGVRVVCVLTWDNVTHQRGRANRLQAELKTNHPSSVACDGYRKNPLAECFTFAAAYEKPTNLSLIGLLRERK